MLTWCSSAAPTGLCCSPCLSVWHWPGGWESVWTGEGWQRWLCSLFMNAMVWEHSSHTDLCCAEAVRLLRIVLNSSVFAYFTISAADPPLLSLLHTCVSISPWHTSKLASWILAPGFAAVFVKCTEIMNTEDFQRCFPCELILLLGMFLRWCWCSACSQVTVIHETGRD